MLAVSQLQSARHLLRCPWLWHARSLHRCLLGQAALLHPQAACRVVIKGAAITLVLYQACLEEGAAPHTGMCLLQAMHTLQGASGSVR